MVARTAAWKSYNWRIIWLSLLYAAFLLPAVYGFKHHLIGGVAAWIVAVLPAIPIIGLFAAMGRYLVDEKDEYLRMLMVRQMLWAMGFTLSCATIWGFLDNFGLVSHVDGYWIVVLWYFGQSVGAIANKLTLGTAAQCC
jgi:ABC-type maltose transport system permease subunit